MHHFIETICFENGKYHLLDLHQQRLYRAFLCHFPGVKPHELKSVLPALDFSERYKVRVVYNADQIDVEFSRYIPRIIREIRIMENDTIDYAHKYEERSELQTLFGQRGTADEILIVKDGWITDSFYANPAFWDGENWYTPKTFLLRGVRRQHLLDQGLIKEKHIRPEDIYRYKKVSLVNALNHLGECILNTKHIK